MTTSENQPLLHVPARDIPVPTHLSQQAQAFLAAGPLMTSPGWPPVEDAEAWHKLREQMDGMGLPFLRAIGEKHASGSEKIDIDGVTVYVVMPRTITAPEGAVFMDIHGGSLVWGGGESCCFMGMITTGMVGARVWAVDYLMPPEAPYPAGLDDCVTAYRALLRDYPPEKVIVGGASAGCSLAGALILRVRDEGLPMPAGLVLQTPEIDLTESGDSFHTLLGVDTALTESLMPANLLYAAGHDLSDPYLSPLFGDFSKGFIPTFLQSGTRDLFLSNTVRMHRALRAADIPVELHIWDAATHVMFIDAPEAEERDCEIRRFCNECWNRSA